MDRMATRRIRNSGELLCCTAQLKSGIALPRGRELDTSEAASETNANGGNGCRGGGGTGYGPHRTTTTLSFEQERTT
jgi:hypothetical protein